MTDPKPKKPAPKPPKVSVGISGPDVTAGMGGLLKEPLGRPSLALPCASCGNPKSVGVACVVCGN